MVVDGKEYDFHLFPSGIINPKAISFIGKTFLELIIKMTLCSGQLQLYFIITRKEKHGCKSDLLWLQLFDFYFTAALT